MKKLVLFDIDGTIIFHTGLQISPRDRFSLAVEATWGVTPTVDVDTLTGLIDTNTAWAMLTGTGVTKEQFIAKFPEYIAHMHKYFVDGSTKGKLFQPIPPAVELAKRLLHLPDVHIGLLTGNARTLADWKLDHTQLSYLFDFGLYGDEADDRNQLAGLVFEKAKAHFGYMFAREDITVIGDTIYDIRCGKAIGATTIGVTTGRHGGREDLEQEHATFVVDSLLDPIILSFFGLAPQKEYARVV